MADAVDAHETAQAPPMSKGPPSMPAVSIHDTPTEPATSPRSDRSSSSTMLGSKSFDFLRLEDGPREKNLSGLSTRWMVNDGTMDSRKQFDALLRKAAPGIQQPDYGKGD